MLSFKQCSSYYQFDSSFLARAVLFLASKVTRINCHHFFYWSQSNFFQILFYSI